MFSHLLETTNSQTVRSVHMFSTQFYTKLTSVPDKIPSALLEMSEAERNYENVRRWTKKINIFEGKKTLFFPINEKDRHWYLIVVFIPDVSKAFEIYAVVLDSLGGRKDSEVEKIKDFLLNELKNSKKTTIVTQLHIDEIETIYPRIPVQPDGSSCGLYIIHYVKKILRALEEKCLSSIFGETSSWFSENLDSMRYDISKLIKEAADYSVDLPYLQFFPTAAKDKAVKRLDRQSIDEKLTNKKEVTNKKIMLDSTDQNLRRDKKKTSYQEYLQNIEDNEEDYTVLWSYGVNIKTASASVKRNEQN